MSSEQPYTPKTTCPWTQCMHYDECDFEDLGFAEQVIGAGEGEKIIGVCAYKADDGKGFRFTARVIDSAMVATAEEHGNTPEEAVIALMRYIQSNPMPWCCLEKL